MCFYSPFIFIIMGILTFYTHHQSPYKNVFTVIVSSLGACLSYTISQSQLCICIHFLSHNKSQTRQSHLFMRAVKICSPSSNCSKGVLSWLEWRCREKLLFLVYHGKKVKQAQSVVITIALYIVMRQNNDGHDYYLKRQLF